MADFWRRSRPVAVDEVRKTGCFTTLPVRINARDDLAEVGSRRFIDDWKSFAAEENDATLPHFAFSMVGHLASFLYPEATPDTLGYMAYILDLGFAHDDINELGDSNWVPHEDGKESSLTRPFTMGPSEASNSPKRTPYKALVAQTLLDIIRVDETSGIAFVESMITGWRVPTNPNKLTTLDEYLQYRLYDAGHTSFWEMVRFSGKFSLTADEKETVKSLEELIFLTNILVNDYWSWHKELRASETNGNSFIVNAVPFLMTSNDCGSEEALQILRDKIIARERIYCLRKARFYDDHPDSRSEVIKYIELMGFVVSGNQYWCSVCDRYNQIHKSSLQADVTLYGTSSPTEIAGIDGLNTTATEHLADQARSPPMKREPNSYQHFENIRRPNAALLAPYQYISSLPSKKIRHKLIDALDLWFRVPKGPQSVIEEVVDLLHHSSLMLDDVEDHSVLRRGKPSTHTVFGVPQAVNTATFLFVRATDAVRKLQSPDALSIFLEDLENLHDGQSLDLNWRHNMTPPSTDEYLYMVSQKTGAMFRIIFRLMQCESAYCKGISFDRLAALLGKYFQVRDDYLNLKSDNYTQQKGFCEDLDEGKFSYPVIHCIQSSAESKNQVLSVFRQQPVGAGVRVGTLPEETKRYILEILETSGSLKAALDFASELKKELEEELESLEKAIGGKNPILRLLIKILSF